MEDIAIVGRKTFFIACDGSLIRDSQLERLMTHGYEAYSVVDDGVCSMKKKVEDLIGLFPGCILYFNIDARVAGIEWKGYIMDLCDKHRGDAKIGIVLKTRPSAEEDRRLVSFYLSEAGITAGSLVLTSDEGNDYERMLEALARAGARGRRETVRVEGGISSSVLFQRSSARLRDISRAYFSCIFDREQTGFNIYDHFHNVTVNFDGMTIKCDAVLVMKHSMHGENRCIFMFVKEDGSPELAPDLQALLDGKIYRMLAEERRAAMRRVFASQ